MSERELFADMDEEDLLNFEEETGLDPLDREPWGPEDYGRAIAWLMDRAAG